MIDNPSYQDDLNYINGINIPWSKLDGSSVLITGGTGLIGTAFVDALLFRNENYNAGITLWILGRNEKVLKERFRKYCEEQYFHFILQDVCDSIHLDGKIDYIIHCAGKGDPHSFAADPVGIMNANYFGTYQVLELARTKKVKKVLFVSTGEVHGRYIGNSSFQPALREEDYGYIDILNPRSCYASSKRAAETLCISYSSQYEVDVSIARPCHTYGVTMLATDSRVICQFIRNAIHKEDIALKSEGIQRRSYCYAADTVTAMLYILLKGENGKAYNIAKKASVLSIRELAELVAKISGTKVIREYATSLEKKGFSDITNAVLDPSGLEELGWAARYSIEEGLAHTINIFKNVSFADIL